jgi:ATP adenylyltransferase
MERVLNHLWSPWRMEYILSEKKNGCVFCEELDRPDGFENLIIHRAQFSFVILNRYPYTSGHLMIVPYLHKALLEDLSPEIRAEMMELSAQAIRVLRDEYQPQGFNLGVNIGEVAGAGILDHIHLHVVPRWGGDTNFMSSVAEARVLPESLEETYGRVLEAWKKLNNNP